VKDVNTSRQNHSSLRTYLKDQKKEISVNNPLAEHTNLLSKNYTNKTELVEKVNVADVNNSLSGAAIPVKSQPMTRTNAMHSGSFGGQVENGASANSNS